MPIDEQTQVFLERAGAKPPPPPGSVPLAEFRAAVQNMKALDYDFEPVADVRDVDIPRAGRSDLAVRVYRPHIEGTRPVFVWAHGGSWVRSSVDASDHLLRILANRSDCVIVAVEYRLSPECQFPEPIEDVYDALAWAHDAAPSIGADPNLLAVGGESSGANLAAAATMLVRERAEFALVHQVLIAPLLDAAFDSDSWARLGSGYLLTRDQLEWAVEQYAPGVDRRDPLLSPVQAQDLSGLPPALIVTGEYDPLSDDGERYAVALEAAGIAVRHVHYEGLIHHALLAPKAIALGGRVLTQTAELMGESVRSTV
jgi:acetyl esterase/lipase